MSNDSAILEGGLAPWPSKDDLAEILRAAGLNVCVGRYSIRVRDCYAFSFEQYGGDLGDPIISADAETQERMTKDAQLVSGALSAAGVRHRFEIYVGNADDFVEYLHHDWPIGS